MIGIVITALSNAELIMNERTFKIILLEIT